MSAAAVILRERRDEFEAHLNVVKNLEDRLASPNPAAAPLVVERRHVTILKAGLFLHAYNIVEAVLGECLAEIEAAAVAHPPSRYTEEMMRTWARGLLKFHQPINNENRDRDTHAALMIVRSAARVASVEVQKPAGNWNTTRIYSMFRGLGCRLDIAPAVRTAVHQPVRDDMGSMDYVWKARNDLAHGTTTFESVGREWRAEEIGEMATSVLDYIHEIVSSVDRFTTNVEFVV